MRLIDPSLLFTTIVKYVLILVIAIVVSVMLSCSKKGTPKPVETKPQKSVLIYPNLNEACLSGKVISSLKNEISFSWSATQNTEIYELNIKNLLSAEVIKKTSAINTLTVELDRNTPYSWFVVSKKGADNNVSDTWKFYNSGVATTYYAPFPADQLNPALGQSLTNSTGKITLTWEGKDVDDDIAAYDIYFGTASSPILYKANVVENKLADVSVNAATTYYWKVITKDLKGNSSDSGLFKFLVK